MAALVLALVFVLLTSDPSSGDHSSDVRCLSCEDVSSPDQCMMSEQCALDEVCFTREIFDHQGRHAFRLGCESKAVCDVTAAAHVFGRREPMVAGSEVKRTQALRDQNFGVCFQCCASDHCNSDLCSDVVGVNKTDQGSHLGTPSHCPPGFDKGPNSCLYFSTTQLSWMDARAACERLGASLVKVEDREEDLFILQKIKAMPIPSSSHGYWTGGYYDRFSGQTRWLDGSVVRYSRWAPAQPDVKNTAVFYGNPAMHPPLDNFEWFTGDDSVALRYICEDNQ